MKRNMKKGERTKACIIEATARLLQTQGYHGTGLKQILTESGAPRGSLYFHFPGGKEELACAAIAQSGAEWRGRLQEVVNDIPDLGAALITVCRALADQLSTSDYQAGCPLATVTLEASASIDAVHEICSEHYRQWHTFIKGQLNASGVPADEAQALSMLILSAIEGALLISRAHRDAAPLEQVGTFLARMLTERVSARTENRSAAQLPG